jgi:branched-chain amino acid transport system substrate-binding protein
VNCRDQLILLAGEFKYVYSLRKGEAMKMKKILIPLITLVFLLGLSSTTLAKVILIGGLKDTTGATSDVGKDAALGQAEFWSHYVNDMGGINGKKVKYIWFDYGYRIPEAITKYKLLKRMGVIAIMGWGTGDTEALSPTINKDQIPYVSDSYSAHLTRPKDWVDRKGRRHIGTAYNLFFSPDYSTNARSCLTAWYDKKWPKHPDYGKRKPRLVCSYMFGSPYASAPIAAIKDHATMLGFEIGPDQEVSLFAIDTKSQIMALKKFVPDVVWHGNTTMSVAATIRDAYALGLQADHIVNNWGFDENLPRLAGEAMNAPDALTVMGATPNAFFGQPSDLMDKVVEYAKKVNPGVPLERRLCRTVQGWANGLVLWEAMKRADKAGDLTGPGIMKKGFETMRNFHIGLGTGDVTYTADDHRPTGGCWVQEWKDGKFQKVEFVDVKGRWPKQWASEWHGW